MQSGGPNPGKRYRFNSPPGWPTYPPEWVPPPGWKPDPRWPAAPPGWPFWSEIAPEKKSRRGLIRAAQVTAGILSFVATVIGLGVVIHGWLPKPDVRLSDWATSANRTCDKYYGQIYEPTVTMYPQMYQAMANITANKADPDGLGKVSEQLVNISAAYRALSSDLDAIPAPKNRQNITDLIKAGQDISAEFGAVAAVMTKWAANQATTADATQLGEAMSKMSDESMPAWFRISGQLNLDRCKDFAVPASATPTPVPPSPTPPSPGQLTAAQQALVARIKSSVLTDCQPTTQPPPAGAVAVNCRPVVAGTTRLPAVIQFQSQAAMNQWMSTNWQSSVTGLSTDCAEGNYNREWTSPATNNLRAGQVVCKQTATNDFTMAWTFDTAAVGVVAEGADGPSLFQWWKNNAYLIASS